MGQALRRATGQHQYEALKRIMAGTKSKKSWMQRHVTDPFVRQAQKDGYRSRAAYKLAELMEKDKLLRRGALVVDLGAAPGSWSQWVAQLLGNTGRVIAIDLLPMAPLPEVAFVQGDFTSDAGLQAVEKLLAGARVDLVLSDMAPNLSGVASADQARMANLVELSIEFARSHLKPDGALVVKVFQGEHFQSLRTQMLATFRSVAVRKPQASRAESAETYFVGRGLREADSSQKH